MIDYIFMFYQFHTVYEYYCQEKVCIDWRVLWLCKVKCALVQAPRLCTGRTAHWGSRGIALLFLEHGTRRGWGVSVTPRPLYIPGKHPVPIVQEAGCAPGRVWTGAENLAPAGIRSPDRPARSQSLYRLRYPPHTLLCRYDYAIAGYQRHPKAALQVKLK